MRVLAEDAITLQELLFTKWTKKPERTKIFVLSKCQKFVNKMFQTTLNAEFQLVNHSIWQTSLLHIGVSKNFHDQKCKQSD